ncbi:unnamed protein product [Phytophthora fragariaefolia]|uniref:Unnamed protein product n=1 Tax=Phytophthora fragariaefolia TaxID=1490495 RepID=A0A9W6X6A6_9STRA|nr:unnamed protein product [Phytophthora fragariaefolia]
MKFAKSWSKFPSKIELSKDGQQLWPKYPDTWYGKAVKEGMLKRRTTFIKPALTPENKLRRVEHALSFIDDRTLDFEPMHTIVHGDEKWFYSGRDKCSYLVLDGEELAGLRIRSTSTLVQHALMDTFGWATLQCGHHS